MANKAITLIRRCKTPEGWRRYTAAFGKNGRVRPGYVQVGDRQVFFEVGVYEIRFYEGSKLVYRPAGEQASEALAMMNRIERQRAARVVAEDAGVQVVDEDKPRAKLADKAREHVADAEKRHAMEAAEISRRVGEEFLRGWKKVYVDEVTREDFFDFHAALRKKGNSDRTVANKHVRLASMLRFAGIDPKIIPPRPKYEKALPTIYERDQVGDLLRNTTGRLHLVLGVAMMCGLREQETMYLSWSDINQRERTLRVQGKVAHGFRVKDSEQRDVPIPDVLFEELKAWATDHPTQELLFPAPNGKPDGHLLRGLKAAARDAGLNCGRCEGCLSTKKECREWTLHKFRRSYLTTLLRSGVDLRTAQAYAGHNDLASTMRYLRPASGDEARQKVNAIAWT